MIKVSPHVYALGKTVTYETVSPDRRILQIGRYIIRAELGRGAFTRVFRASDPSRVRPVAIKVPAEEDDKELFTCLRNEAAAVAALRHRNIVTIYEWGAHEETPYIAEEYLEGETLQRVIAGGKRLTLPQAMQIMSQIACAVSAAQSGGLIHLDMKPANIMRLADGTVKLMDFGAVQITEERAAQLAEQGYLRANIRYASPEQFGSSSRVDALSDVFVYGVIYYELLTGVHPFDADGTAGLIERIVSEQPAPLRGFAPECPEALEQLVHRALAKDPGLRYPSLDELQKEAGPILADLARNQAEERAAARIPPPEVDLEDRQPLMPALAELPARFEAAEWSRGIFAVEGHTTVPARGASADVLPEPEPPSTFRLSAWKRPILVAVPLSLLLAGAAVYFGKSSSAPAARVEGVGANPAAPVPIAQTSPPTPEENVTKPSPLAATSPPARAVRTVEIDAAPSPQTEPSVVSADPVPTEERAPEAARRAFDPGQIFKSKKTRPPDPVMKDEDQPPSIAGTAVLPGLPANPVGGVVSAPRPPAPPTSPDPTRQGGSFQEPKLMSAPQPVVPQLAKERGVYGVVKLEITIAKDGSVKDVTVLTGNPFLTPAAREAALQRRYQPAMLNGQPIELKVPVQFVFRK